MKAFQNFSSTITPLPLDNVDTDMIFPGEFLTSISQSGHASSLFLHQREADAAFPLLQSEYEGSRILFSGNNFGCGSSREHAVWALQDWGFSVIIAPSFADIFAANSAKNGLLLICLPKEVCDSLFQASSLGIITAEVNLQEQLVTFSASLANRTHYSFEYDPYKKHCLVNGLDDFDYLLAHKPYIDDYWKKPANSSFHLEKSN
jgi:3-isopropylmalate/(R)-2-methylmalate dehydratase small subunit